MNDKDRAWEAYQAALNTLPSGSKAHADAITKGPAGFMYNSPDELWRTDPTLHELQWRSFWGIPKVESDQE